MLKLQLLTILRNHISELNIVTCSKSYLRKYIYMAIFRIVLLCLGVLKSAFEADDDIINIFNE